MNFKRNISGSDHRKPEERKARSAGDGASLTEQSSRLRSGCGLAQIREGDQYRRWKEGFILVK